MVRAPGIQRQVRVEAGDGTRGSPFAYWLSDGGKEVNPKTRRTRIAGGLIMLILPILPKHRRENLRRFSQFSQENRREYMYKLRHGLGEYSRFSRRRKNRRNPILLILPHTLIQRVWERDRANK